MTRSRTPLRRAAGLMRPGPCVRPAAGVIVRDRARSCGSRTPGGGDGFGCDPVRSGKNFGFDVRMYIVCVLYQYNAPSRSTAPTPPCAVRWEYGLKLRAPIQSSNSKLHTKLQDSSSGSSSRLRSSSSSRLRSTSPTHSLRSQLGAWLECSRRQTHRRACEHRYHVVSPPTICSGLMPNK